MKKPSDRTAAESPATGGYTGLVGNIGELLETARRTSARAVNAVMTATYWEIGRRIVEFEQRGKERAEYGNQLLANLSTDLTTRYGRGFGLAQIRIMRQFFLTYPTTSQTCEIPETPPPSIRQSLIGESDIHALAQRFQLTWTHYTRLLRVENHFAREFYEIESLRRGWTVRQLERQISSQFYERTALSKNKVAMLSKGGQAKASDEMSADDEIRDPLVLEFLGLKDEYSESQLEDALIHHLEGFLMEMGGAFAFVGRQKRLRIDHEWFRVDLLFFHRKLRSLIIVDLKTGPLKHSDVGQMHLYLNYAREHWCEDNENPPIGLILCTEKGESLARYALEGLPNQTLVREYRTVLPDEKRLADEIQKAWRKLANHG
jgi:predicted nuclease of restriction endonuclease-like (RecB) superfamily